MPSYLLDTSAFAKLYYREPETHYLERLVGQPGSMRIISRLTLVEMESVFATKVRTGVLDPSGLEVYRRRLRADISQRWIIVGPAIEERHYFRARQLLSRFGVRNALRTLDALQLAIALDLINAGHASVFVAADHRLCKVAIECGCSTVNLTDQGIGLS